MKTYNYELARKIIETFTSLTDVESVSMGMQEDWYWTAETVWENGEYTRSLSRDIGGINGSAWATPVIQVDLANGEQHVFNCYEADNAEGDILKTIEMMGFWASGPASGPITARRLEMEIKDFKDESTNTDRS